MQKDDSLGWVWKINAVERVRMFVWLAMKSSILTNVERLRRRMVSSNECPRCGEEEMQNHLFREC